MPQCLSPGWDPVVYGSIQFWAAWAIITIHLGTPRSFGWLDRSGAAWSFYPCLVLLQCKLEDCTKLLLFHHILPARGTSSIVYSILMILSTFLKTAVPVRTWYNVRVVPLLISSRRTWTVRDDPVSVGLEASRRPLDVQEQPLGRDPNRACVLGFYRQATTRGIGPPRQTWCPRPSNGNPCWCFTASGAKGPGLAGGRLVCFSSSSSSSHVIPKLYPVSLPVIPYASDQRRVSMFRTVLHIRILCPYVFCFVCFVLGRPVLHYICSLATGTWQNPNGPELF